MGGVAASVPASQTLGELDIVSLGGGEFWLCTKQEQERLINDGLLRQLAPSTYKLLSQPPVVFTEKTLKELELTVESEKVEKAVAQKAQESDVPELKVEDVRFMYVVNYVVQNEESTSVPPLASRRSSAASFITPLPTGVVAPTEEAVAAEDQENVDAICVKSNARTVAEVINKFVEAVESGQSEVEEEEREEEEPAPSPPPEPPMSSRRITRSARRQASTKSPISKLPDKWDLYCINENEGSCRKKRENKTSPLVRGASPKRVRS